jgi:uncharacterized small protein (DUF1192 family)
LSAWHGLSGWLRGPTLKPVPRYVTTAPLAGKFARDGVAVMPAVDDDDRPKKKVGHEIGQDLTLLSAGELRARITVLKEEIARLEADIAKKQAVKKAADAFFKS